MSAFGKLSDLQTLDRILATVSTADTEVLRKASENWKKVTAEIGSGHDRFARLTGAVADHWKGAAFDAYQASAAQAANSMAAWALRAPKRAEHIDRVVEIIEYMQWLLRQKQKSERNVIEQNLTTTDDYARRLVEWWQAHPEPKPELTPGQLNGTRLTYNMVGIDGDSRTVRAEFVTYGTIVGTSGGPVYRAEEFPQRHKELFDFYDKVARDVADKWGAEIRQLTTWSSPPPYIGLGNGTAPPVIDPRRDATRAPRGGGASAPGGGKGAGSGGGGKPPPKEPKVDVKAHKDVVTKPQPDINKQQQQQQQQQPVGSPDMQSPLGQPQGGEGQPQGGEGQQPPGSGGTIPPPGSGGTIPPPVPPVIGTNPGTTIPLPIRPGTTGPTASSLDPRGAGGGVGAGSSQGLTGRMAEGGNVLSGRSGSGAAGQAGAMPPMYPPMAPGAGHAGGVGGRSARMRRPVPLGGPTVLGEAQVGQGKAVTGRPADRKKAEPPRQAEEQVTGWETPQVATTEELRPVERGHGV